MSEKIKVPIEAVQVIIGPNRATIDAIKAKSGAQIKLTTSYRKLKLTFSMLSLLHTFNLKRTCRTFKITGKSDSVKTAIAEIQNIVESLESKSNAENKSSNEKEVRAPDKVKICYNLRKSR